MQDKNIIANLQRIHNYYLLFVFEIFAMFILQIIAQRTGSDIIELISKATKELSQVITLEHSIYLLGLALFAYWLLKTSLGRYALANSVPRRNNMPFYAPFIPLFIWFWFVSFGGWLIGKINYQLPANHWQIVLFDNFVLGVCEIVTIVVMIFLAKAAFVRRLKGFGLNAKTIPKDIPTAILNLLSVWPIIVAIVILMLYIGRFIWGQDLQMPKHEQLNSITAYPQLPLRITIVITTVIIAPVFEEMLFRGLFQTMLRSFLQKPWLSILISSALFASIHQMVHWPALFILSICLGYAYEKSGSLFRPIFIHALFNGITIAATLSAVNQ
jgi:membrane protease YdiL (CAAX protease family)